MVTVVDGPAVADGRFAHDEDAVAAQRAADDSIDHETPLSELFEDQLACADMIVVSKTDTMTGDRRRSTVSRPATGARDGVHFVRSRQARAVARILLGLGAGAEDDVERATKSITTIIDDEDDTIMTTNMATTSSKALSSLGEIADPMP